MPDFQPLPSHLADEIEEFKDIGAEWIELQRSAAPADIVYAIKEKIGAICKDGLEWDQSDAIALGVLLGEQYVRRFHWHWGYVCFGSEIGDDTYYPCVLSRNRSLSIQPIMWVTEILSGHKPNNILLNFNMIATGHEPRAQANQALGFH